MATQDLVANFGGVGDGQRVTVTGSWTSGGNVFTPATNIFAANGGDPTGKAVYINASGFAMPSDGPPSLTITAYNSSTGAITVNQNAASTISNVSCDVLWGTDNTTAMMAYRTWAQGIAPTLANLTVPAGRYCVMLDPFHPLNTSVQSALISGPPNNPDSCIFSMLIPPEMRWGGDVPVTFKGLTNAAGTSARLNSTTAGAMTATLVDKAGYGSRITVGAYCFVTGYDMQSVGGGSYGYPPNPYFYETNKITAYDSSTGTITFQTALKYAYQSDWPAWSFNPAAPDQGGPATIYVLTDYDRDVELRDITIDHPYGQSACHGRRVVLTRVKFTGYGVYPTQNAVYEAYNCTIPFNHEIDKINGTVLFQDCTIHKLQVQSASPDVMTLVRGTLDQMAGSPKKLVMTDVVMTGLVGLGQKKVQLGPAYGRTNEVGLTNVSGLDVLENSSVINPGIHGGGFSTTMPLVSGVFKFLKSDNDAAGAAQNPGLNLVPGTWLALDDKLYVQITRVWEDGTYVYHQTNLPGAWPLAFTNAVAHPCPNFTMRGCAGAEAAIEDYNQAPASRPLWSYSKRTYTDDGSGNTLKAVVKVLGTLGTVKFTVTATGAATFHESGFDNWTEVYKTDYTATTFAPQINMAHSGLRTLTGNSAASGAQTGDTLPDLASLGALWFKGASNSGPAFSTASTGAIITVEFVMDQGLPPIVPTAVMPLRFRLHA